MTDIHAAVGSDGKNTRAPRCQVERPRQFRAGLEHVQITFADFDTVGAGLFIGIDLVGGVTAAQAGYETVEGVRGKGPGKFGSEEEAFIVSGDKFKTGRQCVIEYDTIMICISPTEGHTQIDFRVALIVAAIETRDGRIGCELFACVGNLDNFAAGK